MPNSNDLFDRVERAMNEEQGHITKEEAEEKLRAQFNDPRNVKEVSSIEMIDQLIAITEKSLEQLHDMRAYLYTNGSLPEYLETILRGSLSQAYYQSLRF